MILDLDGRLVSQKPVTLTGSVQTIKFNLANHAQGTYVVKVIGAEGTITKKVIV